MCSKFSEDASQIASDDTGGVWSFAPILVGHFIVCPTLLCFLNKPCGIFAISSYSSVNLAQPNPTSSIYFVLARSFLLPVHQTEEMRKGGDAGHTKPRALGQAIYMRE